MRHADRTPRHAASQVAFYLGAAERLPILLLPLAALMAVGHWSIVERGSHYRSDMVAGWSIGLASAIAVSRGLPPGWKSLSAR